MEVRNQAVLLVIVLSAIARFVLSRRIGLSTGPNTIFCLAGIGISSCPHIIGTSLSLIALIAIINLPEVVQRDAEWFAMHARDSYLA